MKVFVSFILFMAVLFKSGQTTQKVCWDKTWYNSSAPTKTNRSEYETQPAKVLDTICTFGSVIAVQCRDSKGEPFQNVKNDTVNSYLATCSVAQGLVCNPYNNTNSMCPDYEINYGCACANSLATPITTTLSMSTNTPGKRSQQCGNEAYIPRISHVLWMFCVICKLFFY